MKNTLYTLILFATSAGLISCTTSNRVPAGSFEGKVMSERDIRAENAKADRGYIDYNQEPTPTGFARAGMGLQRRAGSDYKLERRELCAGLPKVKNFKLPPGFCLGMVRDTKAKPYRERRRTIRMRFRSIAELDGKMYVVNMHGWNRNKNRPKGGVYLIEKNGNIEPVVDELFQASSLAVGNGFGADRAKKFLYAGLADSVIQIDPIAKTKKTVISNLPAYEPNGLRVPSGKKGSHPLTQIAFDSQNNLYVSVGSFSNNCNLLGKENPHLEYPCKEEHGKSRLKARSVIRKYNYDSSTGYSDREGRMSIAAYGLRNSMAMATVIQEGPYHDRLLQAENARDKIHKANENATSLRDLTQPAEELNLIVEGEHYGWPYCYHDMYRGTEQVSPEYQNAGVICDGTQFKAPMLPLPAHSAPLNMLFYKRGRSGGFPNWYEGKLLVALHGYREGGHRIVAFDVDPKTGLPFGPPLELVGGWETPQGNPVGMAIDRNGDLWITEDKNQTVLRLHYEQPEIPSSGKPEPMKIPAEGELRRDIVCDTFPKNPEHDWLKLVDMMKRNCVSCHDSASGPLAYFPTCGLRPIAKALRKHGMVAENHAQSAVWQSINEGRMPRGRWETREGEQQPTDMKRLLACWIDKGMPETTEEESPCANFELGEGN